MPLPKSHSTRYMLVIGLIFVFCLIAAGAIGLFHGLTSKSIKKQLPSTATASPGVAQPQGETPEEAAKSFYTWYSICLEHHFKDPQGSPKEDCPYQNSPHLSPDLKLVGQGKDPLLCSQNVPTKVETEKAAITGDQATLIIHPYYLASGADSINLDLQKNNKNWQIIAINCQTRN